MSLGDSQVASPSPRQSTEKHEAATVTAPTKQTQNIRRMNEWRKMANSKAGK